MKRLVRWTVLALCSCALAVSAFAQSGTGAQEERIFAEPDEHVSGKDMAPPAYPMDLAWQGVQGVVLLIVTVDEQGGVDDLMIEKSSGSRQLDQVALERARTWRFNPAKRKGVAIVARVRVPMQFTLPPEYDLARVSGRERDAYFEQRRSGVAPVPTMREDGMLAGFIDDALPIGFDTVAQARQMLERYALKKADAVPGAVIEHVLRDEEGLSVWSIASPPQFPLSVVRRRLVGDAEKSWYVSSVLCEAAEDRCVALRQMMRSKVPAQPALQRLPELPPLTDN